MLPENLVLSEDIEKCLRLFFENKQYSLIGVLLDENTERDCYPLVKNILPKHEIFQVSSGEVNKTLNTCSQIWTWMTDLSMDRHALIINLGGGVLGDMGGFCASTYKRGVDFINIPTTLLSQVDASLGGKLGIDFQQNKNHIGIFKDPKLVVVDSLFLKTLDSRELRSGFAEVIKHILIADAPQWNSIKNHDLGTDSINDLIPDSILVKAKVVTKDPFEKGLRKILNFGHTIGHAIESEFLDREISLLHGEAIAVGMICEAYLSTKMSSLSQNEFADIVSLIDKHYERVDIKEEYLKNITARAIQDKKNVSGRIQCVLLKEIGTAIYDCEISQEDIAEAINFYKTLMK